MQAVVDPPLDAFVRTLLDWHNLVSAKKSSAWLNHIWVMLAQVICSQQRQEFAEVFREIGSSLITDKKGIPPTRFFRERLLALANSGVSEGFLAVAMRETMEALIRLDDPEAADQWKVLADRNLPLWVRFSRRGEQDAPPYSQYRPLA